MPQINCQFSNPLNWENKAPASKTEFWNYQQMICENPDTTNTLALIQNQETGAEFYLDKTINYGEVLILIFFLLFAIFGIIKVITDFWIPHRVIRKS